VLELGYSRTDFGSWWHEALRPGDLDWGTIYRAPAVDGDIKPPPLEDPEKFEGRFKKVENTKTVSEVKESFREA
jgi:hypothetical protein